MLPSEVMQNSTSDSNDRDYYTLNFSSSQPSQFYGSVDANSVNQSNIPGLLRLVNNSHMGVPSTSPSALQNAGQGVYSSVGSKRPAHEPNYSDHTKCESYSDSEKYASSHTSLSPQVSQCKSSPSSLHGPMKKTKGRVKIKMEFIDNKLRRYTTFSKRKTGIMKKAYELSTLTGTQVMLLVASETGHVYTFATRKLQPMITSEAGKALIQTCLNSPDPPTASTSAAAAAAAAAHSAAMTSTFMPGLEDCGGAGGGGGGAGAVGGCHLGTSGVLTASGSDHDQRMSATGYEETDLCYNIAAPAGDASSCSTVGGGGSGGGQHHKNGSDAEPFAADDQDDDEDDEDEDEDDGGADDDCGGGSGESPSSNT